MVFTGPRHEANHKPLGFNMNFPSRHHHSLAHSTHKTCIEEIIFRSNTVEGM